MSLPGTFFVIENVPVVQEMDIVVPGVPFLWSCGLQFPEDLPLRIANGEDVFSVGSADKNEAVLVSEGITGESEED